MRLHFDFRDSFTAAVFTFALRGVWVQRAEWSGVFIDAVVAPVDVGEFKAEVTFTDVASECVHTLPATRTRPRHRHTLVDVDTDASVGSEP